MVELCPLLTSEAVHIVYSSNITNLFRILRQHSKLFLDFGKTATNLPQLVQMYLQNCACTTLIQIQYILQDKPTTEHIYANNLGTSINKSR